MHDVQEQKKRGHRSGWADDAPQEVGSTRYFIWSLAAAHYSLGHPTVAGRTNDTRQSRIKEGLHLSRLLLQSHQPPFFPSPSLQYPPTFRSAHMHPRRFLPAWRAWLSFFGWRLRFPSLWPIQLIIASAEHRCWWSEVFLPSFACPSIDSLDSLEVRNKSGSPPEFLGFIDF